MKLQIISENIFRWSFYILIIRICIPFVLILPGVVRTPLPLLSTLLFLAALFLLKKPSYLILFILLTIFSILYYFGAWNEMMNTGFLINSIFCWEIFIYSFLCLNNVVKPDPKIIKITAVIVGVTALTTFIGLNEFPLAVREHGRAESYSGIDINVLNAIYRRKNIVGWSQLYGMTFCQGPLVYYYKQNHSKLILTIIILNELCILNSQLTFAILISFLILFLTITNIKTKNYCLLLLGFIAIFSLIYVNLDPILTWILDLSKKNQLSMLTLKLQDLYNLLVLHISTGDATDRFNLYTKSLKGIAEYPFGLFLHPRAQATDYIGFHSEMFDLIGTFGIYGLMFIIFIIFYLFYKIYQIKNAYSRRFIFFMFMSFLIMATLNPVFYSPQMWLGAFLLPVTVIKTESHFLNNDKIKIFK